MTVLGRYLLRHTAVRVLVVLFTFLAFALVFDLMDAGPEMVQDGRLALGQMGRYALLRLPSLLAELLPFAVVIGALFAVAELVRRSELVALWGASLSPAAVAARLWPLALFLVAFKLVNDDLLVPRAADSLRAWGIGPFAHKLGRSGELLWARVGGAVLRVDARAVREGRLERVGVFRLDGNGVLVERIEAERARVVADGLELERLVRYPVGTGRAIREARMRLPGTLDLEALGLMARPASELSLGELARVLEAEGFGIGPSDPYRTWWHHRLAGAAVPALFLLLPFLLAREFHRAGGLLRLAAQAIAGAFFYQILSGLLVALGEGGFLPPPLAAWLPPLALAAALLILARRAEGGRWPALRHAQPA